MRKHPNADPGACGARVCPLLPGKGITFPTNNSRSNTKGEKDVGVEFIWVSLDDAISCEPGSNNDKTTEHK